MTPTSLYDQMLLLRTTELHPQKNQTLAIASLFGLNLSNIHTSQMNNLPLKSHTDIDQ